MLEEHFANLEQTVRRLCFHGAKISVRKCEFAKSKILFLGWVICRDFIIADPRRIEKVVNFAFLVDKKSARAFLGLVNSLRRVISINVIEQMSLLTPLTSSKNAFEPTEVHRHAFESIKKMLVSAPLFNNLIDEKADKIMWCDASTGSSVISCILAQKINSVQGEKTAPPSLDLDDEVHRYIFDNELSYEPTRLYTELPIISPPPLQLEKQCPLEL